MAKRTRLAALGIATALAGLVTAGLGTAVAQEEAADWVVTAPVQVSGNPDPLRAHAAPVIGVNPTNGELVIVDTEFRTTMTCGVYLSTNDGRTWHPGGDVALEPYSDCGRDPVSTNNLWLDFASDGTLYVVFTANDPQYNDRSRRDLPRHVFLARSTNSGRTFDTGFVFEAPTEIDEDDGRNTNRRPRVEADPNDPQRVYVSWQQAGSGGEASQALIAASGDGGRTFGEPVSVSDERGAYHARVAVDGEGVLHAAIPTLGVTPEGEDPLPRAVDYRRSTDGGATWSDPVEIHPGFMGFRLGRKWEIVADPDSSYLYTTWYGAEDTDADEASADRDLWLMTSPDSGDTWRDPVKVNDVDDDLVQHYDPGIAVAPNGRVDIAWFDFRNSPYPERPVGETGSNFDGFHDVYYAASPDRGESITPNVRITDRLINREIGVWSNNSHIHGHVGVASTNEAVYFAWQDTRNGSERLQSEDVYFASIQRTASGPSPAAARLAGLPPPMLLVTVLLVGMGLAMVVAAVTARRIAPAG